MRTSRLERRERDRSRKRTALLAAAVAITIVIGAGAAVAVFRGRGTDPSTSASIEETTAALPASTEVETTQTLAATMVEVPDVYGETPAEAERLLTYAGLVAVLVQDEIGAAETDAVISQDPAGGAVVAEGSEVRVHWSPAEASEPSPAPAPLAVVCIDPGHQQKSDTTKEPIGPGSSTTKERVRGGATGVSTGIPEYEMTLEISMKLRERLEKSGVEVVMTREAHDVNISNAERAEVANQAGADLFVRIHADGSTDPEAHGITTLYPAGNGWVAPIEVKSRTAAESVQTAVVASTGAASRGLVGRDDITGFNWSKVPAILVETGFLSNPTEDRLLVDDAYQDRLAEGMAQGILEYLGI
jgi:N-acetylmuramoyl-L-alanine amidase